ncbi:MAG TPA: hypothetical protein VHB50_21675 [Bryobacteraceae bacterium]|nr:hypothetical protein [Bryobacteraceae bacterium]
MRRLLIPVAAFALTACGSSREPAAKTEQAPAAPAPVKDDTAMLPAAGRTSARVVPDHILDEPKLPGGTLGEYESAGKKYHLFIIDAGDKQKAAFLLLDLKSTLQNPEYISYMGGYFGTRQTKPAFVFAKLQYLAGVIGLPKDDADPIARVLAARLH